MASHSAVPILLLYRTEFRAERLRHFFNHPGCTIGGEHKKKSGAQKGFLFLWWFDSKDLVKA